MLGNKNMRTLSREDIDEAYVTSLHASVTGPVARGKGVSRRQYQVSLHEAYQLLLRTVEDMASKRNNT